MPIDVILNGDFESGRANWSGTDIEFNPETAYISGSPTNRVSEIDGNNRQITVLEQTFTVTGPVSTALTLQTALRNAALPDQGIDGFIVQIIDSNGVVIASQTVLPVGNTYQDVSVPVTFAAAGNYTLRFTEIGDNDSLGAIIDNVSLLICFANGTMIDTPGGAVAVETLGPGDVVTTMNGPKLLRWVGRRALSADDLAAEPRFAPVRICAGALGCGLPKADLLVSRQHRMLAQSPVAARMFGARDVLLSAIKLAALPGIYVDHDVTDLSYFHLLFDDHEIVFANGAPSESMLTGKEALDALTAPARAELALMFPALDMDAPAQPAAFLVPAGKRQRHFVARLAKNNRFPLHDV